MMQTPRGKMRVALLDVVRGLAASAVVVHHVLRSTPALNSAGFATESASGHLWVRFAFLGELAVTLFFVLSGASLAISLLNQGAKLSLIAFYIKRFFRIYPVYLLAILIYFAFRPVYALLVSSPSEDWISPQFTNPISLRTWGAYLSMTFNIVEVPTVFTNVLWSLPIEFQFYLFFPLFATLCMIYGPARGGGLVIVFCAAAIMVNSIFHLPGQTIGRLWEFGGGVLLGLNMTLIREYFQRSRWQIILGLMAIACFVLSRLVIRLPVPFAPSNSFDVFFSFVIVLLALSFSDWHPNGQVSTKLVEIGWWSYSIYLMHCLWLGIWVPIVSLANFPPAIYAMTLFLLVYPLTVGTSRILYSNFERPFIDLGRKTANKVLQSKSIRVPSPQS